MAPGTGIRHLAKRLLAKAAGISLLLTIALLVGFQDDLANFLWTIGETQQTGIFGQNLFRGQHEVTNPVDETGPVRRIIENDREMVHLLCLDERQCLEQFIHRAKAAGEDDEGLAYLINIVLRTKK